MTVRQNTTIMLLGVVYFLGQIATGATVAVATLFSTAILFGLYAIPAAGGLDGDVLCTSSRPTP
jgi:hypothetical protein